MLLNVINRSAIVLYGVLPIATNHFIRGFDSPLDQCQIAAVKEPSQKVPVF